MSTKYSRELKLKSVDGTRKYRIYAHEGKRGYNVGSTLKPWSKTVGMKAMTGNQNTFENRAEADAAFDELAKDALAAGWIPRSDVGSTRRTSFIGTPVPPGSEPVVAVETVEEVIVPIPDPAAEVAAEPVEQIAEVVAIGEGKNKRRK